MVEFVAHHNVLKIERKIASPVEIYVVNYCALNRNETTEKYKIKYRVPTTINMIFFWISVKISPQSFNWLTFDFHVKLQKFDYFTQSLCDFYGPKMTGQQTKQFCTRVTEMNKCVSLVSQCANYLFIPVNVQKHCNHWIFRHGKCWTSIVRMKMYWSSFITCLELPWEERFV